MSNVEQKAAQEAKSLFARAVGTVETHPHVATIVLILALAGIAVLLAFLL